MNIQPLREQYKCHRDTLKNIKESFVSDMPEHPTDEAIIIWAASHLQSQRNCMIRDVDELTTLRLEVQRLKELTNE